jgi:hypothetical protein
MDQDKMQLRFIKNSVMNSGFHKKHRIFSAADKDYRFLRKAICL